jgi:hypothetical protein
VKKKAKQIVRLPASPALPAWRYIMGIFFGSIEYWPRLVIAVAVLIAVIRARVKDLPQIVSAITKALESSCVLGWVVAACILISSIVVVTVTVQLYRKELDRLATKRDELQERLLDQKVQRSSPEQ